MDKKLEQAVKPELRYDVRNATPPGQEETSFYPAIVTTLPVKSMDDIVKDMEETGRIPGLRAVAVQGLLYPALMEQVYRCLAMGYSIDFGAFFIRLYLTGTTNPSGTLSAEENTITAEFILKEAYALQLSDYALQMAENDGTRPIINSVTTANGIKNRISQSGEVNISGNYLAAPQGSTTHVYFENRETGMTAEVTSLNFANSSEINFDRPAAIIAGGEYNVYVGFKDDLSGRTIVSRYLKVTVDAMPNPHVMSSIAQTGQGAGIITFTDEGDVVVTGTDLADPTAVWIDVYPDGYDAAADMSYRLDEESLENITATATTISFTLFDNHSHHAGRDFKGKLARVWASYADGFKSFINAQFKA